jgi:hypothetical protein
LFGILNTATLLIIIPQEDQFVLLAGPKASHTLFVQLDHAKRKKVFVQHDDLVRAGELVKVIA